MARFFASPQGVIFGVFAIALIIVTILIEIGGFILLSWQVLTNQEVSGWRTLLRKSLSTLPKFIGFGGLLILVYSVVLLPLTKLGPNLSLFSQFQIPPFIREAIELSAKYQLIYFGLIAVLLFFSFRLIFTFHFMILGGDEGDSSNEGECSIT